MEHIYITLIQVVFLFSLGLAYYIWKIRFVAGAKAFSAAILTGAFWALAITMELISPGLEMAERWVELRFASLIFLSAAWFIFVLQYNRIVKRLSFWHVVPVLLVPLVSVGFMLTNARHHLFIQEINFIRMNDLLVLVGWKSGIWFTVYMLYSYFLVLASISILVYTIGKSSGYQRSNNIVLLLGSSFISITHLLYLADLPIGIWLGLAPVSYILSGILYVWATFRLQMFGLLPTIQNSLIPWMNDGMMVLDESGHLVYANPIIENSLSISAARSFGQDIRTLLPQLTEVLSETDVPGEKQFELNLVIHERTRYFEVRSILMDRENFGHLGWLLIFHDITQRNRNREMIINAKKEWELTFDAVSSMIILTDQAGYIFRCNRITCDWFDATYTQLLGQNISRLFFGEDHPAAQLPFPRSGEIFFPGLGSWFELSAYSLDHETEQSGAAVYIIQDITSRMQTEQERNQYARRLEAINKIDHAILSYQTTRDIAQAGLEQINELSLSDYCAVWLIDEDTRQIKSLAFVQDGDSELQEPFTLSLSLLPPEVLLGKHLYIYDIHQKSTMTEIDRIMLDQGWTSYALVALVANQELLGVLCLASNRMTAYEKSQRDTLREIGMSMAVGLQNSMLFEKIQHLAITDPLTALYNRRHFFDVAENELQRARRFKFDISLVMLDIDFFKNINDEFGHLAGDQVLQQMAAVIRNNMRRYDVLARFGGEEFIILLPRTDMHQAREFSDRLLQIIRELEISAAYRTIHITVSIGVASVSGKNIQSVEPLIECADQAMYTAKSTGRNRVVAIEMD